MAKKQASKHAANVEAELSPAGATALASVRALNYEVQCEGSDDVIAMRSEAALNSLGTILRATGYPSEATQIQSAASSIGKKLSASYGLKPNARGQGPGGLADDPILLKSYVEMAAESMELENFQDAEVNDEVLEVAAEYDAALRKALAELVEKYPPENDATAEDLWEAEAPYLVLMTLRGEGVGIWDGDWDGFYEDTQAAEEFLKKKLGRFSDGTGGGKLETAFMNAASESLGEGGDDDESDEEE